MTIAFHRLPSVRVSLWWSAFLALLATTVAAHAASDDIAARKEYDFLQGKLLDRTPLRREELVRTFEQFIDRHEGTPTAVEAMIGLAMLLEERNPPLGYVPDKDAAVLWLRAARSKSPAGSSEWVRSSVLLAGRLHTDLDEARSILNQVIQAVAPNDLNTVTCKARLVEIALAQKDVEGMVEVAEDIARREFDPMYTPSDPFEQNSYILAVRSSVTAAMAAVSTLNAPKAERSSYLERLARAADKDGVLSTAANRFRSDLARAPEVRPIGDLSRYTLWTGLMLSASAAVVVWLVLICARRPR